MGDDLDQHTNTYQIYSKDPKHCLEFLGTPDVINWKQHLQIQSKGTGMCAYCCNALCVHLWDCSLSWHLTLQAFVISSNFRIPT